MEMASAIARKSQSAETDNGAQYISFTDLGPAIDCVDANTNACTGPWLFGSRCVFGIPTFILALFIVITCRFCWRKFKCLFGCMSWCCRSSKKMDNSSHPATTPSSPTCEAVDMEAAMERLEFDTVNPDNTQEESHYATPAKQLHEAMKSINESAANRARAALHTFVPFCFLSSDLRFFIDH